MELHDQFGVGKTRESGTARGELTQFETDSILPPSGYVTRVFRARSGADKLKALPLPVPLPLPQDESPGALD